VSRWFRFYPETIHDPKILELSDGLYRAWTILLCIASEHDGELPSAAKIAISLRVKPHRVAEWLTALSRAGLMDNADGVFSPHNWQVRQYKTDKSDPTGAKRAKDYRDRRRDARDASRRDGRDGNEPTSRPETETEPDPETDHSETIVSGADAPRDFRKELFQRGLDTLRKITGKGPDACRSFVGKCLKAAGDDAVTVLGLIDDADRNRVVDPSAWIAARLKTTGPPGIRPLTEFQRGRNETRKILDDLGNFAATGGSSGAANFEFLSGDTGEQPAGVRGGPGQDVIDLPRGSYRAGG
jgi:hypothetical protein